MMRNRLMAAGLTLAAVAAAPALAQDQAAEQNLAESTAERPVAVVNGETYTQADLVQAMRSLPEQYQQAPMQQLFEPLREQVIQGALLLDRAESENLADDPAVQESLEQAREAVLQRAVVTQAVEEATTPEKLQAAYEERKSQPEFGFEEVKARHILLETEEAANEVIQELEGGADFAQLAQERSTGPSGPQGGDLGYFRRDAMVAPFAEAAFNLEPGSYTQEPVQTQFGYHVILVEDKRQGEPSFEDLEPQLREELARQSYEELMAGLGEGVAIERFDIDGQPAAAPEEAGAAPQE